MYDYSKLDGRIKEIFGNRHDFAVAMGYSDRTVSLKMNGKVPWQQKDISRACDILDVPFDQIPLYFFKIKVQSIEQTA